MLQAAGLAFETRAWLPTPGHLEGRGGGRGDERDSKWSRGANRAACLWTPRGRPSGFLRPGSPSARLVFSLSLVWGEVAVNILAVETRRSRRAAFSIFSSTREAFRALPVEHYDSLRRTTKTGGGGGVSVPTRVTLRRRRGGGLDGMF